MSTRCRSQFSKAVKATALGVVGLMVAGCASSQTRSATSLADHNTVVLASEVDWGALNPARGNNGPGAANLWGDRTGTGATGMLVRFADGFSSPPHIHNITYRGVVIRGMVHNDDPNAEPMWMPSGSYWTQPAGEVHITAAKGASNLAYIEIQQGPYLVLPSEQAEDIGERPVNIHESNLVWLDARTLTRIHTDEASGPKLAFLWGDPQDKKPSAAFVYLPTGFDGALEGNGASLRVVVIEGQPRYGSARQTDRVTLEPGSYVGSANGSMHRIHLAAEQPSVLYVRSEGDFAVVDSSAHRSTTTPSKEPHE